MSNGNWVCGFAFDPDCNLVVLIEKKTGPEILHGYYNGVGGKVEEGEDPALAMTREFEEEAGVRILQWRKFAILTVKGYGVVRMFSTRMRYSEMGQVKTQEVEPVMFCNVEKLPHNVFPNLKWLIPMAKDVTLVQSYLEVDYASK